MLLESTEAAYGCQQKFCSYIAAFWKVGFCHQQRGIDFLECIRILGTRAAFKFWGTRVVLNFLPYNSLSEKNQAKKGEVVIPGEKE